MKIRVMIQAKRRSAAFSFVLSYAHTVVSSSPCDKYRNVNIEQRSGTTKHFAIDFDMHGHAHHFTYVCLVNASLTLHRLSSYLFFVYNSNRHVFVLL